MNDKSVYIFVSSERQERVIRRIVKKLKKHNGSIALLFVAAGLAAGMMADMNRRLNVLEARMRAAAKQERREPHASD